MLGRVENLFEIYFSPQTPTNCTMKVIQDLATLYSALLLLTGESGQVSDVK